MTAQRIAFRTDASSEIGMGHFMRCLALADALLSYDCEIQFISRSTPEVLRQMLLERRIRLLELSEDVKVCELDELPHAHWLKVSQRQDAMQTVELLNSKTLDWLIVDHYAIDHRWEKYIRRIAKNILVIDDLADRIHDCDILLDQNLYQEKNQKYVGLVPEKCTKLIGPQYALLRKEFREARRHLKTRSGEVNSILIFLGGIDLHNYTSLALQALKKTDWKVNVDVVVGQYHPCIEEIQTLCMASGFVCHVQSNQIALLMARADLAIGAGGVALWERCCMGLPSICIVTASNQKAQIEEMSARGLIISIGEELDFVEAIYNGLQRHKLELDLLKISSNLTDIVDGYGALKVMSHLVDMEVQIRLATKLDSENIFSWRNHPSVRKYSKSNQIISWQDHEVWLERACRVDDQPLLIGELEGRPIGVVRFEIKKDVAEVSIYLVQEPFCRGFGKRLLSAAEKWLTTNYAMVGSLRAVVLRENEPSIRLFEKMCYVQNSTEPEIIFIKKIDSKL